MGDVRGCSPQVASEAAARWRYTGVERVWKGAVLTTVECTRQGHAREVRGSELLLRMSRGIPSSSDVYVLNNISWIRSLTTVW